jgi:hypothetical protein
MTSSYSYSSSNYSSDDVNPIDTVCEKYGISNDFVNDLMVLTKYDIVLLCDDSGSMQNSNGIPPNTRWDELKNTVNIVIELSTCFDKDGIDIKFLNRKGKSNVTELSQSKKLFKKSPSGRTPMVKAIEKAYSLKSDKPMLLIIATDGLPNEGSKEFEKILNKRFKNKKLKDIYVSILACTNEDDVMDWLNKVDIGIKNVDVLDDYYSELKEIIQKQGPNVIYTKGDHIARMLLGPIFEKYDQMDEICFAHKKSDAPPDYYEAVNQILKYKDTQSHL